jgi:hypothetical protein
MTKLTIDDRLITPLISEVAPLVSSIISWDLQISNLRIRLLPKDQGYEQIVQEKLRLLGLPASKERDIVNRAVEYLVENNLLAAYESLSNELMIVRENVDDSNLEGLKLILAHELTHRGQHVRHPELFERVNRILINVFKDMEAGKVDLHKTLACFEEVKPIMTLIESHASYVQTLLKQHYFPQAQIETRFTLPVILFRILGVAKISQYTEGLPQVAEAMQHGTVEALFHGIGR